MFFVKSPLSLGLPSGVFFFRLTDPILAFFLLAFLPLLGGLPGLGRHFESEGGKSLVHALLGLLLDECRSLFGGLE